MNPMSDKTTGTHDLKPCLLPASFPAEPSVVIPVKAGIQDDSACSSILWMLACADLTAVKHDYEYFLREVSPPLGEFSP